MKGASTWKKYRTEKYSVEANFTKRLKLAMYCRLCRAGLPVQQRSWEKGSADQRVSDVLFRRRHTGVVRELAGAWGNSTIFNSFSPNRKLLWQSRVTLKNPNKRNPHRRSKNKVMDLVGSTEDGDKWGCSSRISEVRCWVPPWEDSIWVSSLWSGYNAK